MAEPINMTSGPSYTEAAAEYVEMYPTKASIIENSSQLSNSQPPPYEKTDLGLKSEPFDAIDAEMTPEELKKYSSKVYKNIILISLAFLFNFTSYNGLSKLQSSLHRVQGMGVINQSILYGGLVISCLFVPKIVISFIGHKWTIALSFIGYVLWMAANGYAVWGTMVPASILVGLCAAPLWTAQCSYFTISAVKYAKINKKNQEHTVTRFFGIFFMFFQASNIIGNIISAAVLQNKPVNATDPPESVLQKCGAADCPGNKNNTNLDPPSKATVWTMVGIYIAVGLLAIIVVALFVDRMPKELVEKEENVGKRTLENLLSTLKHLRHTKQIFIIPLTMYSGFEQAFFSAEWSKSYISCSLGIWTVGVALLPFGVVNAIFSYTSSRIASKTGRIPLFVLGFIIDIAIQITLFAWKPHPNQLAVFFIISALWGITDAIWQTQINALYGCLFPDESEAAFCNYRMWESFGFIIAFAYSNFLCTYVKLSVLMAVLIVGMAGYLVVEWLHWKSNKVEPLVEKEE